MATWFCATIVVASAVLLAVLAAPVLDDPSMGFADRKGRLVDVELQSEAHLGSNTLTELRLVSGTGLAVSLTIRTPVESDRRRPAVLLLGGKETGRDAARLGGDVDRVVVAALSYPYAGDPGARNLRAVLQARQIQRAVLDTVPAILLATDYLLAQPYVDPMRLELVGVSLGAFLVSPAAVLDERIRRVWVVHGAGRPRDVIEHALRGRIQSEPVRRATAAVVNALLGGDYLAAERWVGRISPRPVVAINATDDERLPRASVDALHAALRSPCEIVWMAGRHVQPDRPEVIDALRVLILERIVSDESADRPSASEAHSRDAGTCVDAPRNRSSPKA